MDFSNWKKFCGQNEVTLLAPFLLPAHVHISKIPQALSSEKLLIIQLNSIH